MRLHLLTPLWFDNRNNARAYATHRRQRLWRQFAIFLWLALVIRLIDILSH